MNAPSFSFTPSTTSISGGTAARPSRCAAPKLTSRGGRTTAPADPFAQRFGKSLPRELRTEANQMTWSAFEAAYSPAAGPLRLEVWTEDRINSSRSTYTAELNIAHAIRHATANAAGPISAMTAILHDAGYPMEVTSFHQQQAGEQTATFIRCTSGDRQHWAMGMGADCTASALAAFIAAANLLGPRS